MIIPTITAIAKSNITVVIVTTTIINTSFLGTRLIILKDAHSNVSITTIIITPIKAARGIILINGIATKINTNKKIPAVIPDKRPRPPEEILIILCPIIAQPPIPLKKLDTMFPIP
ncbi:hypothetical protein BF30_2024 [Francisella philomiragia]|nr:hypothetical protein BF30_2024 [Francisella philomiragia]